MPGDPWEAVPVHVQVVGRGLTGVHAPLAIGGLVARTVSSQSDHLPGVNNPGQQAPSARWCSAPTCDGLHCCVAPGTVVHCGTVHAGGTTRLARRLFLAPRVPIPPVGRCMRVCTRRTIHRDVDLGHR